MKNVFVTGAASGIGRSIAKLFARKGWFVGMADCNGDDLKLLQDDIGFEKCSCHIIDVTSKESVDAGLRAFASRTYGRLELLVNSAGVLSVGPFESIAIEDHHRIVDVNIKGAINCAYAAFELLKSTPGSKVINLSSVSAVYGMPDFASYSASKFAIRGLTEALNIEWEKYGIEVSDIMAPLVNTPMLYGQQEKSKIIERLGPHLKPETVAKEVYRMVEVPQVHREVTLRFKWISLLSKALPGDAQRRILKALSGN